MNITINIKKIANGFVVARFPTNKEIAQKSRYNIELHTYYTVDMKQVGDIVNTMCNEEYTYDE